MSDTSNQPVPQGGYPAPIPFPIGVPPRRPAGKAGAE